MVNLIPPKAKKSVVLEYWLRVLTVWSAIATFVAVLFAVSFLPTFVLVDAKIDAYQESADLASQKIASFESVSNELARSTQQAQLIISNNREISLSSIIELFDSLETNGIELDKIFVSRTLSGTIAPVSITGSARDRQALSDFRDRLLSQDEIEVVDFPLSNLAKDRDIAFSITVTMSNKPSS